MANGSAVNSFEKGNDVEMGLHDYPMYPPSPPPPNSSLKNSVSVPGTPLSSHSSMKPSNSYTNVQQDCPAPISGSSSVHAALEGGHKATVAKSDNIPLTNNLSVSSIEDNGEQKVVGSPDVRSNMGRHMSVDYKPSNLDSEGVIVHRRESSFS